MPVAWILLLWAGLAASLASAWLTAAARWHGLTRLHPSRLLACLLRGGNPAGGLFVGFLLRVGLGVVVLPFLYAIAFHWLGRAEAGVGALLGLVQAQLVGFALPLLARRRCRGPAPETDPGLYGRRLGGFTPLALLGSSVLYGTLLGYIYVLPG